MKFLLSIYRLCGDDSSYTVFQKPHFSILNVKNNIFTFILTVSFFKWDDDTVEIVKSKEWMPNSANGTPQITNLRKGLTVKRAEIRGNTNQSELL
jgi:hypothetical protein